MELTDNDIDRYIPPTEAAKFLSVSLQTLVRWRTIGEGPKYFQLNADPSERKRGVRVRYRKRDLIYFMETGEPQAPRGHECGCACGLQKA